MTLLDAYEKFIYQHKVRGNKETSLTDYKYHLLKFMRYFGPDYDIRNLSNEYISEYILSLQMLHLSQGTVSSYVRTVRIFCRYLSEYHGVNIKYREIYVPKMPARDCPIYTKSQFRDILNACKSPIEWITVRNRLAIVLMYDSGLRQIEVCRLKKSDLEFENNRMKVFGKGDKYRHVPLGHITRKYIEYFFSVCPYKDCEYVLCSDDGSPLSGNAIRIMTNRLKRKLGFPFSSHILRHNFATNYLLDKYEIVPNLDISGLKVIMGHVSTSTTNLYVHLVQSIIACRDAPSHLDSLLSDII